MELVVDASVVIRWLVTQDGSARAQEFLSNSLQNRVNLVAPHVIYDEVLGTLARLYRRKEMTADQVHDAHWLFRHIRPELRKPAGIVESALRLALRHQLSYWDALYVALALLQDSPLVTADARLYRSVGRTFPNVRLL